jgi:inhibitor of KinA sporulation pathway (predicted exonuclease)
MSIGKEQLLIIDLEATCWKDSLMPNGQRQHFEAMEVIEIGCVLASRDGRVTDSRSFLVKPSCFPEISAFCSELTGITQSMLEDAPLFPEVASAIDRWITKSQDDLVWVSWGNYDLHQLVVEREKHGTGPAFLNGHHLNLRKIWRRTTGQRKRNSLFDALAHHNLTFEGQQHRGIDDARNIVRLLPYIDWTVA